MTEFKNGDQVLMTVREHLARHDGDIVKIFDIIRERECQSASCRAHLAERLHKMEMETKAVWVELKEGTSDKFNALERQVSLLSWKVTVILTAVMLGIQYGLPMLLKAM